MNLVIGRDRVLVDAFGRDVGGDDRPGGGFYGEDASLYGNGWSQWDWNDYIDGRGGNDRLVGLAGDDTLIGGTGFDTLIGGDGNDLLEGGIGTDFLQGDAGNDTYLFDADSGWDYLIDRSGENQLRFAFGVGDLAAWVSDGVSGGYDLHLQYAAGGYLSISDVDLAPGAANRFKYVFDADNVEEIFDIRGLLDGRLTRAFNITWADGGVDADLAGSSFADAMTGNAHADRIDGRAGDDTLAGAAGADTLIGGAGDDLLVGGSGDDHLWGGTGSDTYLFATGAGNDSISEGGDDINILKVDATTADLTLERIGNDLVVGVRGAPDRIALGDAYGTTGGRIDTWLITDSEGATFRLAELLAGATLTIWPDSFIEARAMIERQWWDYQHRSMGLGGYSMGADGRYVRVESSLVESLRLRYLAEPPSDAATIAQSSSAYEILSQVGTARDAALSLVRVTGGPSDNIIVSSGNAIVDAGSGNDLVYGGGMVGARFARPAQPEAASNLLYGNAGDDTLIGGSGSDVLMGGAGSNLVRGGGGGDRYYLVEGGVDTILDSGRDGVDVLYLPAVVRRSDLQCSWSYEWIALDSAAESYVPGRFDAFMTPLPLRVPTTALRLHWNVEGTAGEVRLVLQSVHYASTFGIEAVHFGDGTALSRTELLSMALRDLGASAGHDNTVVGRDLDAGTGNDSIEGWGTLRGGPGTDSIAGGDGNDAIAGDEGPDELSGGDGDDLLGFGIREFIDEEFGTVGNIYRGGAGNDIQLGSRKADTFLFERGDGVDVIGDYWHQPGNSPAAQGLLLGGGRFQQAGWEENYADSHLAHLLVGSTLSYLGYDVLRLGGGILPHELRFARAEAQRFDREFGGMSTDYAEHALGPDLLIIVANSEDRIRLVGWYAGPAALSDPYIRFEGTASRPVARVEFADGTFWDSIYLNSRSQLAQTGTSGDDTQTGSAGADWMAAGPGNDLYRFDNVGDTIHEVPGQGIDTVHAWVDHVLPESVEHAELRGAAIAVVGNILDNALMGNVLANLLSGGTGADTLYGGDGDDTLNGNPGADVLLGEGGDDILVGGKDADSLDGGIGNDVLSGNLGDDTIVGGSGIDTLDLANTTEGVRVDLGIVSAQVIGQTQGEDRISLVENVTGGAYNDTLIGDDGPNALTGNGGDDSILGGDGPDWLAGNTGTDWLYGGPGNDRLVGGKGNDYVAGAEGDDVLSGNLGDDVVDGGDGSDTLDLANATDPLVVNLSSGVSQLISALQGYDILLGIENLHGGAFGDYLAGDDGVNLIDGGAGSDSVIGAGGSDTLSGGDGEDWINGNTGNDTLSGGPGSDTLIGGKGDDWIDGGEGDDLLSGNIGDDTVRGGPGSDTLDYGNAADAITVDLGFGGAQLISVSQGRDELIDVENVSGGLHDDQLRGNGMVNRLRGGGGQDVLSGGGGRDVLEGGAGADQFVFLQPATSTDQTARVLDFAGGNDRLLLDHAGFPGIAAGILQSDAFATSEGGGASGSEVRIIFDPLSGILWYDADGHGIDPAVPVAELLGQPVVSANDIFVA